MLETACFASRVLVVYAPMLVVTRKVGERIMIGDKVVVTVVRIAGNIVRVGVEAPANYAVVRKELVDKACVDKESFEKDLGDRSAAHSTTSSAAEEKSSRRD